MQSQTCRHRGRRALAIFVALVISVGFAMGCGRDDADAQLTEEDTPRESVPVPQATAPRDIAVLEMKNLGEIRIELLPELAPKTVESFVKLAGEDFYNGTTFHRVVPGFMIQGGDPNSKNRDPRDDGLGNAGFRIDGELSDVSHLRGVVAMANMGSPDSASSQFFIVVDDHPELDGSYTVFGHVVGGMDVVDAIANTPRDLYGRHGPENRPMEDQVIADVTIEPGAGGTAAPPAEVPPPSSDFQSAEWDEGDAS